MFQKHFEFFFDEAPVQMKMAIVELQNSEK